MIIILIIIIIIFIAGISVINSFNMMFTKTIRQIVLKDKNQDISWLGQGTGFGQTLQLPNPSTPN